MRTVLEDIGLRCEVCTKTSYFPVHVEEARLVSSLLHSTWTNLHENGLYGKILTKTNQNCNEKV